MYYFKVLIVQKRISFDSSRTFITLICYFIRFNSKFKFSDEFPTSHHSGVAGNSNFELKLRMRYHINVKIIETYVEKTTFSSKCIMLKDL